jgi:hypothetical protein
VLRKEETVAHVRRRWLGFQSWEVAAKEGSPRFRLGVLWAALSLLYVIIVLRTPWPSNPRWISWMKMHLSKNNFALSKITNADTTSSDGTARTKQQDDECTPRQRYKQRKRSNKIWWITGLLQPCLAGLSPIRQSHLPWSSRISRSGLSSPLLDK